jgi:serine/threonine protein kinase
MTLNRYEILARLASGGMAELFLARVASPSGVDRHVVLKRVLPDRAGDPHFAQMFLDEARLAAQLRHPNIAQVYDVGRLGSSHFFTMEYVHGENARSLLQRVHGLRRPIPLNHALTITAGAAAGLHHAHERIGPDRRPLDIVHRDVSPSNIMLGFEGAVKLLDFGVAKAIGRTAETRAGTVKGKIAYLSPEQCTGERPVDRRSDLFSLGICLYELLTVRRLFRRDTDFATMAAIVQEHVVPPSRLRGDVPPAIDHIVMTALAKDPDARFPTADAMLDAIENAAAAAGLPLSPGGLGRYLRELFGERPEPWIELESLEQLPPPVTVTGESMLSGAPVLDARLVPTWNQSVVTPAPTIIDGRAAPPAPGDEDSVEDALKTVKLPAQSLSDDDDPFDGAPRADEQPTVAKPDTRSTFDRDAVDPAFLPTVIAEQPPIHEPPAIAQAVPTAIPVQTSRPNVVAPDREVPAFSLSSLGIRIAIGIVALIVIGLVLRAIVKRDDLDQMEVPVAEPPPAPEPVPPPPLPVAPVVVPIDAAPPPPPPPEPPAVVVDEPPADDPPPAKKTIKVKKPPKKPADKKPADPPTDPCEVDPLRCRK